MLSIYVSAYVDEPPKDFVLLSDFLEENFEFLRWYTFEAAVGIVDVESVGLIGTMFDDSSVLVSYQDKLYVNKLISEEVAKQAKENYENHQKVYSVGDKIEIYTGYGEQKRFNSSIAVNNVTVSDEADSTFSKVLIELKIDAGNYGTKPLNYYVDHVETKSGQTIDQATLTDDGMVEVLISKPDEVKYIFVKGVNFEVLRKVQVSE